MKTADFIQEITSSLRFYIDYMRGKPFTRSKSPREGDKMDFGDAFGFSNNNTTISKQPMRVQRMDPENSENVEILLKPYPTYPFASSEENRN